MNDQIIKFLLRSHLFLPLYTLAMAAVVEIGFFVGSRVKRRAADADFPGGATFMAGIFGLVALLLGFSFSGAANRFDHRRDLVIQETVAVAAVVKAIDLIDLRDQPDMRELLRRYLDIRIHMYDKPFSKDKLTAAVVARKKIGREMAMTAKLAHERSPDSRSAAKLTEALSEMLMAGDNERVALALHSSWMVTLSLVFFTLPGGLVSGYTMGFEQRRDLYLAGLYIVLMSTTLYLIMNMEFPRDGVIGFDVIEAEFISLREEISL